MATTTTKQSNSGVLETPPLEEAPANLPAMRPRTPGMSMAIIPQSWQEITAIAGAICRARMAPKTYCDKDGNPVPEKVAIGIMHGLEVGMTPMAALQSIAVINGMPSLYGDGMLGVVRASGLLEDFEETMEWDTKGPLKATCRVKRRGEKTEGLMDCARADAEKAGWWTKPGPWSLTPHRMLQMRARGWALRDKFADVLRGLHSAEEAEDMLDVTPQGSATVAKNAPPEPTRDPPKKDAAAAADTGAATGGKDGAAGSTVAGQAGPSATGQAAQEQIKDPGGAGTAGAEQSGKTAETETSAAGARDANPAGIKPRTGKRKPKDAAKVTDVADQNEEKKEAEAHAEFKKEQTKEAAEPAKPREPITFEPYSRPGDFFTFSDGWIQAKDRTVEELEQWHNFYTGYMQKLKSQGSKGTQDATDDTLQIYGRVMAKLLNKDA